MRSISRLALALAPLRGAAQAAVADRAGAPCHSESPLRAAAPPKRTHRPARVARAAATAALLAACTALGAPGPMQLGGQKLAAASCGVRSTLWIEHYTVVLYLPRADAAAEALIDPGSSKALRMRIINKMLMPDEIPSKWRQPMKENLDPADFARATDIYRSLQPGDRLTLAYAPDTGVVVSVNGRHLATAKGHRLVDALLATWADGAPLREKLNRAIERHPCEGKVVAGASGVPPPGVEEAARPWFGKPG